MLNWLLKKEKKRGERSIYTRTLYLNYTGSLVQFISNVLPVPAGGQGPVTMPA